ncbi:hypothetical protein EVA_12559, partial [gut metagenome]
VSNGDEKHSKTVKASGNQTAVSRD